MSDAVPTGARRHVLISALGVTQILSWGSSYYLPAVLARPIADDTGWSFTWVVAGISIGLIASGLVSVTTGRTIQRRGGRLVLAAGAVLLAVGQITMALAPNLATYLVAWVFMGLGMSAGLYDAGFATLGRLYGGSARSAITALTLWGGFASTVCWPLSALLVDLFGWRGTCLVYAGIQLAVSLPVFLLVVPDPPARPAAPAARSGAIGDVDRTTFFLLATILTLAAFTSSAISVHLLTILQLRGIDLAAAVALGALVGPSQVGARVVEMLFGQNRHPIWLMIASLLLVGAGTGLLFSGLPVTALALVLYGAGNGIHTVARGALPLVLFDPDRYAAIMGRLAPPSLLTQALAPSLGAVMIQVGGDSLLLGAMLAAAAANIALAGVLWKLSRA